LWIIQYLSIVDNRKQSQIGGIVPIDISMLSSAMFAMPRIVGWDIDIANDQRKILEIGQISVGGILH